MTQAPTLLDWDMFYASAIGQNTLAAVKKRIANLWDAKALRSYDALYLGSQEHVAQSLYGQWCVPNWFVPEDAPRPAADYLLEDVLPLRHQSQDIIVMLDTLEWHAKPLLLLEEIWKALRPNGALLAFLPGRYSIYSPFSISSEAAHQALRSFCKTAPDARLTRHYVAGVGARWYHHPATFIEGSYCQKIVPEQTGTPTVNLPQLLPLSKEMKGGNCRSS